MCSCSLFQPPLFFLMCVANLTIQCFPFFKLSNSVFIGEVANFVAYVYAPAVLVTPLGALSIIIRSADALSFVFVLLLMGFGFFHVSI